MISNYLRWVWALDIEHLSFLQMVDIKFSAIVLATMTTLLIRTLEATYEHRFEKIGKMSPEKMSKYCGRHFISPLQKKRCIEINDNMITNRARSVIQIEWVHFHWHTDNSPIFLAHIGRTGLRVYKLFLRKGKCSLTS